MPDTPTTEEPAEKVGEDQESKPNESEEKPNEESPKEETTEEGAEQEKTKEEAEDVPAPILREKLTSARAEAANYRTKLREAEDKLANAKTPEEVQALLAEMTSAREAGEHALVVENVALKAKLDDGLTAIFVAASEGKTKEELEAFATQLAKYAPSTDEEEPEHLSGGLTPDSSGDGFDPVKAAREARATRY